MKTILILNGKLVNEGSIEEKDILIKDGRIAKIANDLQNETADQIIDAAGDYVMPGVIDDQVHFRDMKLSHKAEIFTEARAAVAGGTTSIMEMPNTNPQTVTQQLLTEKYALGGSKSLANYSFYMGATNENLDEVLATDPENVCGIKVFMGSSTGNMLVDNEATLRKLFSSTEMLIATHCEKEEIIKANEATYRERFADNVPISAHPEIRDVQACLESSTMAVGLAKEYGSRLHVLHLTTEEELALFDNTIPLEEKKITAEVCVHHLWFSADDYAEYGSQIKCNPAIKEARHKEALFKALLDDRLDVIATDHAPHTTAEKDGNYWTAPSGLPLVQHSLIAMLDFARKGMISVERVVEKMCHAPAIAFKVRERGYLREGYWADIAIVNLDSPNIVTNDSVYYKCGWTPFAGQTFNSNVKHTIVSGHLAYSNGQFDDSKLGERLQFNKSK